MQTYDKKKVNTSEAKGQQTPAPVQQSVPNSAFLTDGASRIDLPEAMRSKMENAYGTDLSAVKIYQSQKVADGGAEAVTMGNTIAFAPGKFDMTSQSGQALLGHEMSHVVSQSRGEVQGRGVVDNAALEARADKEGAMAAAGEQVYNGPVSAPLSSASPAGLAGPMQCKKGETPDEKKARMVQLVENDRKQYEYINYSGENISKKQRKKIDKQRKKHFKDDSYQLAYLDALHRQAKLASKQSNVKEAGSYFNDATMDYRSLRDMMLDANVSGDAWNRYVEKANVRHDMDKAGSAAIGKMRLVEEFMDSEDAPYLKTSDRKAFETGKEQYNERRKERAKGYGGK